ncbi:uncharacterized protein LOC129774865 [Toxorhynchites rutilus septentrionalis]|uniref:uncharacterized protein LOC129774865 n=1 Tax=Toxorhynchites rutilus septentrionalis TaxID=329112 RepID=UPI00247AC9F2|nr:uncharacterized protein LOC129774865 [Toxorhynchites rutilus septentrionalis]
MNALDVAAFFLVLRSVHLLDQETFVTRDQCKQTEVALWQKSDSISADCDCPPNYVSLAVENHKRTFCVMLTKPQPWSEICVSSGSTDDYYEISVTERSALNAFLRKTFVTEFWISVRKESEYGPPLKKLPGKEWGKPLDFEEDYDIEVNRTSSGECMKTTISNNYSKARFEDCNKEFSQLCVYKRDTMLQLYCSPDEFTTRYSYFQNYCFSIRASENVRNDWDLYDVNTHRKYRLYHSLARVSNARCDYSAVQSNTTAQLQQVLQSAGQINKALHIAIREDGIMTLSSRIDCFVYQYENTAIGEPKIFLKFDQIFKKLMLTIDQGRFLWREDYRDVGVVCYTDADAELIKKVKISRRIWPPKQEKQRTDREIYELKLYGDFPGSYWCEGHSVPNFTVVKTERIVAQRKPSEVVIFSVLLHVSLYEDDNVLHKQYLKQLTKSFINYIESFDDEKIKHAVRLIKAMKVMKIEMVDYAKQRLTAVVHVAVKYSDDADDEDDQEQENETDDRLAEQFHLRRLLLFTFKETCSEQYCVRGINSTEICLPDTTQHTLNWPSARIGQVVAPRKLCIVQSSGLPLTRKCVGDRIYGGAWQQISNPVQCSANVSSHTLSLFNYHSKPLDVTEIGHVFADIDQIMTNTVLIPADIFYLSKTVDNIRATLLNNGSTNVTVIANQKETYYCGVAGVLNRIMFVNESIVLSSQVALNTTNILLDSADDIINQLSTTSGFEDVLRGGSRDCLGARDWSSGGDVTDGSGNGTVLFTTPRLILLITDPNASGISGLALTRIDESFEESDVQLNSFNGFEPRLIYADELEDDVFLEENLEIASYIPRHLLEKIQQLNEHIDVNTTLAGSALRIVISIYFNDNIFKETTNGTILRSNSKIISVTVPGYSSDLPGELPIYFRNNDDQLVSNCGYWEFEPVDADSMPRWSYKGCSLARQLGNVSFCKCSHLTAFSRLCMDIQNVDSRNPEVSQTLVIDSVKISLDIITAIGCALSVMGVAGIFVTATLFPTWRSTSNSKILLQLSSAIAIEMIIIFFDGPDINYNDHTSKVYCTLLGATLHYVILVTFMWMLVIAYLQFLRYVKVLGRLRPAHWILKASIWSWMAPLIPVSIFTTFDYTLYHKQDNFSDICYPHGPALYYGLLLPISVVILINLISYSLIICSVFSVADNPTRFSDRDLTYSQLRLSSFLFFLLGLPWIFGMLITVKAGEVFSYLFCITAPLQGFILFLYFIVMDPIARKMWRAKFMSCYCGKQLKKSFDMTVK